MPIRTLQGAVVAVIGGSGGLGSAIARVLADRGSTLILAGPNPERLAAAAAAITAIAESSVVTVTCDLRDSRAGEAVVAAAASLGRLDGVINAAGVVAFGSLLDTPDELIEELFLINALGPLWMMKRVAPLLSTSKGFFVNISAVVAETPLPNMATYSASKAALTGADAALVRELRRIGVTVCDARPPHTETGLADHPIGGEAPKMPVGLSPEVVARVIVEAIESGATDLPSSSFA